MRKLLLGLANKIYRKYGFKQIREGQLLIFKGDRYGIVSITLKQEECCIDELIVKLQKRDSLSDYISSKLNQGE